MKTINITDDQIDILNRIILNNKYTFRYTLEISQEEYEQLVDLIDSIHEQTNTNEGKIQSNVL